MWRCNCNNWKQFNQFNLGKITVLNWNYLCHLLFFTPIGTLHKPKDFYLFLMRSSLWVFWAKIKPNSACRYLFNFYNTFLLVYSGEVEERTGRKRAQKERKGRGSPVHYYKGFLSTLSALLERSFVTSLIRWWVLLQKIVFNYYW